MKGSLPMSSEQNLYSLDGPFNDPVVRCDSCNKLVLTENIRRFGKCPECGRNKFWNLRSFSSKERAWMIEKDVDPDFLTLFEPKEMA
jgi:predicted RNA-binding Zn-ribbon protein involved in translation (DUF1610 family)